MIGSGLAPIRVGSRTRGLARARRAAVVLCGAVVAVSVIFAVGEVYLRIAPPGDLAEYLGTEAPRSGPFRADSRYGAQYRSLADLEADNPGRLDYYRHLFTASPPPKVWAFFGSSFAQAPGMLADTARRHVPSRTIYNLGKNEYLPVRLAQAEFLLDAGLPVERLFMVLIPLDGIFFAFHSLDQIRVTPGGGIAYDPRLPEMGGSLMGRSRLFLQGWTRTGLHVNVPFYSGRLLNEDYSGRLLAEFTKSFSHFAQTAARHRVPVTVVLLPNHEQVTRGAGFAFQDAITPPLREQGYDVCDVRRAFLEYPDKLGLFVPDKHFSDTGNRLLLATILEHLQAGGKSDLPDPHGVRP